MSSSSKSSIAKKARTRAEADFTIWLIRILRSPGELRLLVTDWPPRALQRTLFFEKCREPDRQRVPRFGRIFASPASGRALWRLREYRILARQRGSATMRAFKPTTYMTTEELQQIAAAKFEEAAALPDGPQKQTVLRSAQTYFNQAQMKGWLSSELQSPK